MDVFSGTKPLQERVEDFARNWKNENKSDRERPLYQVLWIDLADLFTGSHKGLEFEKETAKGGFADVYSQKYGFIVEQKKPGTNLDKPEKRRGIWVTPFEQAKGYDDELPKGEKVSTIVISNFDTFRFYDMTTLEGLRGEVYVECAWEAIPQKPELFEKLFKQGEKPEEEWSILDVEHTEEAADNISGLYQSLLEGIDKDKDLSEEEKKKYEDEIPLIIMRIVFLLFANSTSDKLGAIFKNRDFESFLKDTDEIHLSADLMTLFKCLNIDGSSARAKAHIPPYMRNFPYVDGELFSFKDLNGEEIDWFPVFPASVYKSLNDLVSDFKDWDRIDIFVFGMIMDQAFKGEYRHEHGIYNTSRANIRKVIEPLFMSQLRAELSGIEKIENYEEKREKLKSFHEKLSSLQFLDPACGSGAFLIESFLELRDLEDKVIKLENTNYNLDTDVKVSLSQFHGIELNEYAAMIARTSLYIAREQALKRSYSRFRDSSVPHFLPLKDETEGIVCGNALTMDWGDLVTPSPDLFVFGNPPYKGFGYQTPSEKKELDLIFGKKRCKYFDYCTAWTFKAAKFLNGSGAQFAFVTTSSIVQGSQVTPLFKQIFGMGWKITFAYPAFMWDLPGATVAVVITGMAQDANPPYLLWDGSEEKFKDVENISQYLNDFPTVFIRKETSPISDLPECRMGAKKADGGGLLLKNTLEKTDAEKDPVASKYIRTFLGTEELIHNKERWCIWITPEIYERDELNLQVKKDGDFLENRLAIVKNYRSNSTKSETRKVANIPYSFQEIVEPTSQEKTLAIPEAFKPDRKYFTAGYLSKGVVFSNQLYVIEENQELSFSIVESAMFKAWQDWVGGRYGTNNRFSNTLVWNTFPLPKLTKDQKDRIIEAGAKVLEARAGQKKATLEKLYNPTRLMPQSLQKAHEALDKAVDSVFSDKPLRSEEERQKALLKAYEEMTGEKAGE